jgi:guanylate kinase
MSERRPRVLVLCGPSGVGKTTIAAAIATMHPNVFLSVSATTRPPRPNERDGGNYHFMTPGEFEAAERRGEFLETATVFSKHRYGTPRGPVERALAEGRDVVLEIDVQGARSVKSAMPDAVVVFIAPPSWDSLERRLRGRGTERPEALERRLATAREEMKAAPEFDRLVVNEDLEKAIAEVDHVLMG